MPAGMEVFSRLRRTLYSIFGIGSVNIKDNSGAVQLRNAADNAFVDGEVNRAVIHGNNASHGVILTAPGSMSASPAFTLPGADGSNGHVLKTNGSGVLSFGAHPTDVSDAKYIIQEADVRLPNAQALGDLVAGSLENADLYLAADDGIVHRRRNNFTATTDPLASSDEPLYQLGSRWINNSTDAHFVCLDPSDNAAVWIKTSYSNVIWLEAGSATTIFNITNLPQIFREFYIVWHIRSTRTGSTFDFPLIRFNGDTTAGNYFSQLGGATGASLTAIETLGTVASIGQPTITANNAPANTFAVFEMTIPHYANTSKVKTANWWCSRVVATTTGGVVPIFGTGLWNSTSAITSISFAVANGDMQTGTILSIYGAY